MISAKNIHKFYDNNHILKGIDINVNKGEIISLVGASGAGKTTLLQILGTIDSYNKKENSTELFNSNQTNSQKPFLNFFIERYNDAYSIQLKELISLHKNKIKSRSTFEDGYIALKLANAAYRSLKLKKTIKL